MIRLVFSSFLLFSCMAPEMTPELSACDRACRRMEVLGCEEAQPDEEGSTCVEVCENVEKQGFFSLNPECRARKNSCEEMEQCDVN